MTWGWGLLPHAQPERRDRTGPADPARRRQKCAGPSCRVAHGALVHTNQSVQRPRQSAVTRVY
jgi:hypothetical protein